MNKNIFDDFLYDLNNDSSIWYQYNKLIKNIKKNKAIIKNLIPDSYFDFEDELEYLEKSKETYQEFYNYEQK